MHEFSAHNLTRTHSPDVQQTLGDAAVPSTSRGLISESRLREKYGLSPDRYTPSKPTMAQLYDQETQHLAESARNAELQRQAGTCPARMRKLRSIIGILACGRRAKVVFD